MTEGICLSVSEKAKEVEILKTLIEQNGFDIAFSPNGRFAVTEGKECSIEKITEVLQIMDNSNFDLLGSPQISYDIQREIPVNIWKRTCAMTFKKYE